MRDPFASLRNAWQRLLGLAGRGADALAPLARIFMRWRAQEPVTVHALYHEAKNEFHTVDSSAGPVLVLFTERDRARNFALAHMLTAFLPAVYSGDDLNRDYADFVRRGVVGFLINPRVGARQAGVFRFPHGRTPSLASVVRHAVRRRVRTERAERRSARARFPRKAGGLRALAVGRWCVSATVFDEAAEHFERARELDPRLAAAALTELGQLEQLRNRSRQAVRYLRRAIAALPEATLPEAFSPLRPHALLGYCLRLLGHIPEALEQYKEAWRREPNVPEVGLAYSRALIEHGREKDGALVLAAVSERYPHDPKVRAEYANWLAHQGRFADALDIRAQLVTEHPGDTENLVKLALLSDATDDVDRGFRTFARVIARTGDPVLIQRFHLFCARQGIRALRDGEPADAVRCFRTLTRARPDVAHAHFGLALALKSHDGDSAEVERLRARAERAGISASATLFDLTEEAIFAELHGVERDEPDGGDSEEFPVV